LSKFVTSDHAAASGSLRAGAIAWRLAQTFWVGGLWVLYFVMLPALEHYGLAPALLDVLSGALLDLLLGFAAFCVLMQQLVLLQALGWAASWRNLRGQLLLATLLLVTAALLAPWLVSEVVLWQRYALLAAATCGLLLVLQPVPGES
jgi:hypothetical protein